MNLKNIFKKNFFRKIKSDLKYEESMDIYKNTDAIIIDVRTPEEYKEKHIEGAINIPIYEIENIKTEIINKDVVILVYCKSGTRSKMAKEILIQSGYNNVYTFDAKI